LQQSKKNLLKELTYSTTMENYMLEITDTFYSDLEVAFQRISVPN